MPLNITSMAWVNWMKNETLKVILENCLGVAFNMNDTFYYASADSACIDMDELDDLEPVVEKFGRQAFVAYEAIKRGHDPQISEHASDSDFLGAKVMILDMMAKASDYGEFYALREATKCRALAPNERKKVSKAMSRLQDWFSFFITR